MSQRCQQCNESVYNDLPGGLCPNCLMVHAKNSIHSQKQGRGTPLKALPEQAKLADLFPELEVEELIGHGGMGAVYRVRQKNLDRVVALKVFLYDTDDPEFAARFQREARALAKLNHPNIVTVHDFGQRERLHYLLMEYVDGLNLRQITQSERLNPIEALEMVPQLCDALQYAHDQGVIHRDIKPENLLLDVNGRIKIADFGLAKMTGQAYEGTLTRTQQVMGTLNYMAPEQRERPTEVDHRADIYSLGVVIYEMLTGELPLGRFQPPSSKSDVNASLDEVVMRALEKEPERRYQQASEFKTGFQSVHETPANAPQDRVYATAAAAGYAASHQATAAPDHRETAYHHPSPPVKNNDSPPWENERRYSIAIFSGYDRTGDWNPGKPHVGITMFGGTKLDLTEVNQDHVDLTLFTMFGASEVIVPRGATVDLDGFMMFGALENDVKAYDGYQKSNMRVRVRAYGAMGAASVRTPTEKEVPLPKPPTPPTPPMKSFLSGSSLDRLPVWKSGLVLAYRTLAMVLLFAMILFFALGNSSTLLPEQHAKMCAFVSLFMSIFLWSALNDFRRIVFAGPADDTPQSIRSYHEKSIGGAMIHGLALFLLFGGLAVYFVHKYSYTPDPYIQPFSFTIGALSLPLFWLATQLNQTSNEVSS